MKRQGAAILLVVQLALVLSIAAKYAYERRTRPRVWARVAQYDPNLPLRGRYLALQLVLDACGLPRDEQHFMRYGGTGQGEWTWNVAFKIQDGKLVPVLEERWRVTDQRRGLMLINNRPCDRAILGEQLDYFIPDRAKTPFPLKPGEELWVEVTVPAEGPPRPIQLARSDASGFHVLQL